MEGVGGMATRLGFIGFGIMGERLLRAARSHDQQAIVVAGVFDPSPAAVAKVASIDRAIPVFGSAQDVIAASDCLHIASPPLSHLDYLRLCHASGKAALCEKPLAIDIAEATAVVDELQAKGMRAAVNFPFASSFAVDALRQWMRDDAIGTPARIDIELAFATWPRSWQMDAASWLDGPAQGGLTREVGSHFLFLSHRLFGPLRLLSANCAFSSPGKSERTVEAELSAGALPISLRAGVGQTTKDDHNTWTVTGSKGRMRLRDWSFAEREIDGEWQAPADAIPNETARPLVLARQLDKVHAMTRGETHNLATLSEALEVQRTVEMILSTAERRPM